MNRSNSTASSAKLRKSPQRYQLHHQQTQSRTRVPEPVHWLFRSNIPRRRASFIPVDPRKRNFFGIGEIVGVLKHPARTVRSLTESKRLLEEARREMTENKERAKLRPKHTFSRLPTFFPRKAEMLTLERTLEGDPAFTILFGSSSTGKTVLLREVLSNERFHILHFDLRIAGFADLASLYNSLSLQMELYFEEIANTMEGYDEFEHEAWSFKHDRLNVEKRVQEGGSDKLGRGVKTSDVARLMELFQSSLLKYWKFQPAPREKRVSQAVADLRTGRNPRRQSSDSTAVAGDDQVRRRWRVGSIFGKGKRRQRDVDMELTGTPQVEDRVEDGERQDPTEGFKQGKKMPVIFFDEAHRLPALIQSAETMKCLLDSMVVLTKQDRLCHVIHATSDPFYQTWLRQLNISHHCKMVTIGDCTKAETQTYFHERLLPRVPEPLRPALHFESLFEAFGGKLAHWHDYVTDYVNFNGTLDVRQSSHFTEAYSLLNIHIINSSQSEGGDPSNAGVNGEANLSNPDTLHPGIGPAGFKSYSPLVSPSYNNPYVTSGRGPAFVGSTGPMSDGGGPDTAGPPEFSTMQLLKVMSRLGGEGAPYLGYFQLCKELGIRAVDGMVKGRVLDLRWTECVEAPAPVVAQGHQGSHTAVEYPSAPLLREEDVDSDMVPVGEHELGPRVSSSYQATPSQKTPSLQPTPQQRQPIHLGPTKYEDEDEGVGLLEVVGPKLVPMTPIMRYAMREVVSEYEDEQSISEYASILSDVVEEY
ncbi:hypothetical protein K443DRAFT_679783 [Laccaria amethystina LaAM-08-1]|uniref:AAA+ ATPase domain-containing protein n=1 Tax=Laccaria amethystina LaAM-08-1 TaxID=1095629 RepID=A0A0C9XDL7_9AGAR|nr:hypothetical protein K443DRAFT_679783 [Laccaria amethystina LaAM-08-1]